MIMGIYSIFDEVAGEYGPVFSCKTDGVAARQFTNLIKRESVNNVNDYCLKRLAQYDAESGEIINSDLVDVAITLGEED